MVGILEFLNKFLCKSCISKYDDDMKTFYVNFNNDKQIVRLNNSKDLLNSVLYDNYVTNLDDVLNYDVSKCDDVKSSRIKTTNDGIDVFSSTNYAFDNKMSEFPAIELFELSLYRNKTIFIATDNDDVVDLYINRFEQGSGVYVRKAIINRSGVAQHSLMNACRALAANVLINRTKVLFIVDLGNFLDQVTATKLAYSFSAGLIWLKNMQLQVLTESLDNLNSQMPQKLCPSMSNYISVSSIFQKNAFAKTSSYNSLRQYTRYQRNILTAFASVINSVIFDSHDKSIDVIGYNPEYVDAALLHNTSISFTEKDTIDISDCILPKIRSDIKMRRDHEEYLLPDSQRKLNQIDALMLNLSRNIIYIGSYPSTHLRNYLLLDWRIIFIDPKIDDEYMKIMSKVCPNANYINSVFQFSVEHLLAIIQEYDIIDDFVIIDDSYDDVNVSYEHFQEVKLNFFERIIQDTAINVSYISMKCNLHSKRLLKYVLALLPQPYGGDLDELRLILHHTGGDYVFDYVKIVRPYLDGFKLLSIDAKLRMVRFYHRLLVNKIDAFKHVSQSDVVLALYSITNATNDISSLKHYLAKMIVMRRVLIFNAPNKGRIQYMIRNKFKPGLNVSLNEKDDIVVFSSPSGLVWKDHCLTGKEILDIGYIQVTHEMLSGLLGPSYAGPGFMDNSAYSDMFNLYIPSFIFGRFLLYQHIGTGPILCVKSFSTAVRNVQPGISRSEYYKLRGILVASVFKQNFVESSKYRIIGDEQCAVQVTGDIEFQLKYGIVSFKASHAAPLDINISGHLLSLAVSSHFVPVAIDAWTTQLRVMSNEKNVNSVISYLNVNPILLFDNKVSKDGLSFLPWHTNAELLLTVEILEPYLNSVMSGNYSKLLIEDIKESFVKLEYLSH